eukprot:TCONS_00035821-protein
MRRSSFLILMFFSLWTVTDGAMPCIGKNGKPVDMYVLYKLPKIYWQDVPEYVKDGSAYAYLDNEDMEFTLSPTLITSPQSVAGLTLNQVYDAYENRATPSGQAHLFYNDANLDINDDSYNSKWGHTKGAMAFDQQIGFWMIHSVPHFPDFAKNGYSYPSSGHKYGQMFFCMTLNSSAINDVGLQLRYNNPYVQDSFMPEEWNDKFPNIAALLKGEIIDSDPYYHIQDFISLGGMKLKSFAKGTKFNKDLYSTLVAPTLKINLLTETWQNGQGNLGSACNTSYTVEDVTNIKLDVPDGSYYAFRDTNDHSKYALSDTADNPYVCIGDINR